MKAEKRQTCGKRLSFIFLPFFLCACATTAPQMGASDPSQLLVLEEIAQALTGRYSNHLQWQGQPATDPGPYRLDVRARPSGKTQWFRLLFTQSAPGETTRNFMLEITPGARQDTFEGLLVPLDAAGELTSTSCRIVFKLLSAGFSGETDLRECDDPQPGGVITEIAFDGQQIVTAEKLFDSETGEHTAKPQVLHYFRERRFRGWVKVRENNVWRRASRLVLHSEGGEISPADARGRSLGLRLELARSLPQDDRAPVMRLSVRDAESGHLLGDIWTDPAATEIGFSLPDIQAGFSIIPE